MNKSIETAPMKKLKAAILHSIKEKSTLFDEKTKIRLNFCGGKFAIGKILDNGFNKIFEDNNGQIVALFKTINNKQYEIILHISPTGFLRDVKFYTLDTAAPINLIRSSKNIIPELFNIANELLSKSILEHAPESAFDDFERIAENYTVTEQFASESKTMQLSIIWRERLVHWMTAHPPTAARLIVAAARYPDFCPSGIAMAQASFYAKELGMEGESWIILKGALNLHTDSIDPDYWNWLGCTLDKSGHLELAIACFLESLNVNPDGELNRKNAWIVGQKLIRTKLKIKEFKNSLEDVDRLMSFHEGVEDKDRALMMAATGLCCEGLGLLEEAGERYKLAMDITTDCLVAKFGSNRVTSENSEERIRLFELQLASFPQIPHEIGIDNKAPIEFIEGYSHGDHWDAVTAKAEDFIPNYLPLALEKGEMRAKAVYDPSIQVNGTVEVAILISYPETGEILGGNLVVKTANNENLELWSSYPYATQGESVYLKVISLEEWKNGVEGSIIVNRGGGGTLTLFDPLFFENKQLYVKNNEYKFIVYGFAYIIKKSEEIVYKMSSGAGYELERMRRQEEGNPLQEEETYDVTLGAGSTMMMDLPNYPGEYQFFLPVEMVDHIEFFGEPILVITSHINDDKRNIPIKIYAAKRLVEEGEIGTGDLISGYLWLQGHLLSKEGTPVGDEKSDDDGLRFGKISYKKQESESIDEEFKKIFPQAISSIDAVHTITEMPCKLGNEPDYIVEKKNGIRCFISCGYFDMQNSIWEDIFAAKLKAANDPWVASRFLPLFILGIGYTNVGEGNAFKYFGWEDFEAFLEKGSEGVPYTL